MSTATRKAARKALNAALSLVFALALAVGMLPIVSQPQTAYAAEVTVVGEKDFAPEGFDYTLDFTTAEIVRGFKEVDNLNFSDGQGGYIGDFYTPDVVVDTNGPSGPKAGTDSTRSNSGFVFLTDKSSDEYSGPNPAFKLSGGEYGAQEGADGNKVPGTGTPIYALVEVVEWTYWPGNEWLATGGTGVKNWGYWNDGNMYGDTGQTQRQYYGLPEVGMIAYNPNWTSDSEQKGKFTPDAITNVNFFSSAISEFTVEITFYDADTDEPIRVMGHMTCTDLDNGQAFGFGGAVDLVEILDEAYETAIPNDNKLNTYYGGGNYLNIDGQTIFGQGDILAQDDDATYQWGLVGTYFDTEEGGTEPISLTFSSIYGQKYPVSIVWSWYNGLSGSERDSLTYIDEATGETVSKTKTDPGTGELVNDYDGDGDVDWDDGRKLGFVPYNTGGRYYIPTDYEGGGYYYCYNGAGFFSMTPEYVGNPPKAVDADEKIYKYIDRTSADGASNPVAPGDVIDWRVRVTLPEAGLDVRNGFRADRLLIEDTVHANMTYVQGSMRVTTSGFTSANSLREPISGIDYDVSYEQTATGEYVLSVEFSEEYVDELQMNSQEITLEYQTVMGQYPADWEHSRYEIENRARVSMMWDDDEEEWNWRESNPAYTDLFVPVKTIEGSTELYEGDNGDGVELNDRVTYAISQQVHRIDDETNNETEESFEPYSAFVFHDDLPEYVEFGEDDAYRVIDSEGREIASSEGDEVGEFSYDPTSNAITYAFDEGYLEDGMIYNGREYTLEWTVTAVDQPKDDLLTVDNAGTVTLDSITKTSNTVSYEPASPELKVEKHADLEDALASTIADFEYLSDEQGNPFSLVRYEGSFENIADDTRAHLATFTDALPAGLDLVAGSVKVGGVGAERVTIVEDVENDVVTVKVDRLEAWENVTFEYYCTTNDDGNGKEVVNTATIWAANVDLGVTGAEDNPAENDGEIYVNDPDLEIHKTVSESAVQNDDYQELADDAGNVTQQREEYRVGDEITYAVTLENTVPGTFARNVKLTDDDMPTGLELVGDVSVTGLGVDGKEKQIFYPLAGDSDEVHGQGETRGILWSLSEVENERAGTWGWELNIDYLPCNYPVRVEWTVTPTDDVNGWEIYNQAEATAANQPNDLWSSETPCIWVNTPEFEVSKYVDKTDAAYQVGMYANYNVELLGLKTPGTLARGTTLADVFAVEGADIKEGSFVITAEPERADDISEGVELNRKVGDNSWMIEIAQAFGDTNPQGYWVNEDDYLIWEDGALIQTDRQNPVGATERSYLKVEYDAVINDMALQNDLVVNEATADSIEGYPVTDTAEVTVVGARLAIDKSANTGSSYEVGDVAAYELTVTNTATATTAEDVQVSDALSTAKAGAAMIVDGTIRVFDERNAPVEGWNVDYALNEAGSIIGFALDTNYDLSGGEKLTVRYNVKYLTNNGSASLVNVASARADNAPEVSDWHEVWPGDVSQTDLAIDKGSDAQEYGAGQFATYTINVTNSNRERAAENVTVHDEVCTDTIGIAHVVKGTVKAYDEHGNAVSARITYHQVSGGQIYGFTAETGQSLSADESLTIVYQVRITDEALQPTQIHNEAWAAADNTGRAETEHDVLVDPEAVVPGPDGPGPATPSDPRDDEPALAISKSADTADAVAGDEVRWTISVRQTVEGQVAEDVTVTDFLPAGFKVAGKNDVTVTDAAGNAVAASVTLTTAEVVAEIGDLAYNVPVNIVVKGTVEEGYEGRVMENVARAEAPNAGDPVEDDAEVSVSKPGLNIFKSADSSELAAGEELAWTVTVRQTQSGATARDVTVTDILPDGFELPGKSAVYVYDGNGDPRVGYTLKLDDGTLTAALGDMPYGDRADIVIKGSVEDSASPGTMANLASATASNIDGAIMDDASVRITAGAELKVTKSADKSELAAGDDVTWTISVRQAQPGATARDVTVTDILPDGFEAKASDVTVTDAAGKKVAAEASIADGKLTAKLGDIAYNEVVNVALKGSVGESYAKSSMTNSATAAAANADEASDDARVSVARPEEPSALELSKSADRENANQGDMVDYTITLTVGEENLKGLALVDDAPSGLSIDEGSVKVFVDNFARKDAAKVGKDGDLTVTVGDAEAGDKVVVTYEAKVGKDVKYGTSLTNTVTATADGTDSVKASDTVKVTDPTSEVKYFSKTSDPLALWLSESWMWLIAAAAACVLACWAVPRLAYREDEE